MQTPPTAFANYQNNVNAVRGLIVKLTDGTSTWYFSDVEANLTEGHCYPLINSFSGVYQSFDVFSKNWAVSTAQIIFSNLPYRVNSSDVRVRPSDELSGIIFNAATIYLLCGPSVTGLADCLTYFAGVILEPPYYDDKLVRVTIHDKSKLNQKVLPLNKIGDTYAAAPPETSDLLIPLVYGDFNQDFIILDRSGTGLAVAHKYHPRGGSWVVSDHILDAFSDAFVKVPDFDDIAKMDSKTLNLNASGKGTITVFNGILEGMLYPTGNEDNEYSTSSVIMPSLDNAVDKNTTTSVQINTYELGSVSPPVTPKAIYMMSFSSQLLEKIEEQAVAQFKLSTYADDNAVNVITATKRRLYYFNNTALGDRYYEENMTLTPAYTESASWQNFPKETPAYISPGVYTQVGEVTFNGSDLNDLTTNNTYTGAADATFTVEIDGTGTPNTFKWKKDAGAFTTGVSITGAFQSLIEGVQIKFDNTINHTLGDSWSIPTSTGLDDFNVGGTYTGTKIQKYKIIISGVNGTEKARVERDGIEIRGTTNPVTVSTSSQIIDDGIVIAWNAATGHGLNDSWIFTAYPPQPKNKSYVFGCYVEGKTSEAPVDDWLFDIKEARLKLRFIANPMWQVFAQCKGREYSSWITGRSSNYTSGTMIEDPAGIIESILRDVIGLGNDDIDMPSFITAENTAVKARLNMHSENTFTTDEIIRILAEQSTFAYVWTAAGKAKLIPLNDDTPTVVRTIPISHIVDERITVTHHPEIINRIRVESRFQQEYDQFADNDTYDNTTSQTAYGIREYQGEWENLAGTSVTHLVDHLIDYSAGAGIWAVQHNVIDIMTQGYTNSDLELGDWIALDYVTCDPQLLCSGVSWSGKQFLVTELQQTIDGTRIKAIELY